MAAEGGHAVTRSSAALTRSALSLLTICGIVSTVAWAGDLSRYRDFQLGSELATVAKQAGVSPSSVKLVHLRPALMQDLQWRPQPLGASTKTEPVLDVAFSFFNGELFQIVVDYDRYETEGLTNDDIVGVISASYGVAAKPAAESKALLGPYVDQQEILARWEDSAYRFDLIRSTYGSGFRLIGVLKKLETLARAATLEANRLDDKEAPQRDAARQATEDAATRTKLAKTRLVNKAKFRP
jgi:hypothetical protein